MQPTDYSRFDANALARQLRAIFVALVNSIVALGVLSWFFIGKNAPLDWHNSMIFLFGFMAAAMLAGARVMHSRMTSVSALTTVHDKTTLHQRLTAAFIVAFALSEAAAVNGFVAVMVTGSRIAFLPFGVAALVSMALYFPSAGRLSALAEPALRRAGMQA